MRNQKYAGFKLRTAVLFLNSRKAEYNLHNFCFANKQRCIPYGLYQTEVYVDRSNDRDVDRDEMTALMMLLETGKFETLIIRNLNELTYDKADLEAIMNTIDKMDIDIFELDTMMYRYKDYDDEC